MVRYRGVMLLAVVVSLSAGAFIAAQQTGRALFDQALSRKAAGDLQGATESFERVVADFAASASSTAARALLELGELFDSLGQASRTRTFYDRVRNDFKDQAAEVAGTEGAGAQAFPFSSPDGLTIRFFARNKL